VVKLKALLLVGGAEYHNRPFHYAELAGIFAGEGGCDLRITDDLAVLEPRTLEQYQVIVNWSTFLQPADEQLAALLSAVEGGTGFLGLHAATATFWNSAAYLRMIGSRFIRHDPYKRFTVCIEDHSHPITAGVEDFEIEDELYQLGGDARGFDALAEGVRQGRPTRELRELGAGPLGPDIHVLATAEGWPLLYVKTYGKGRVHYNALGHDTAALQHPSYRRLVLQGLAWVAGQS